MGVYNCRRGACAAAILFLFSAFYCPPAFPQRNPVNQDSPVDSESPEQLPRVSIFPLQNSMDEERYKNLSDSITETIVLNLELIGEHEIVPPPEGARNPEDEETFIEEYRVANIVFGKLDLNEEGEIVIEVSVYDGRLRRNRASFRETSDGFLGTFESSDRLVRSLIGAFTDREIAYGSIELINEGAGAPYSVLINGKEVKPSNGRISRILTGSYTVRIVQTRAEGETVLFDSPLTIQRQKTAQVRFSIPQFTKSEYEHIRNIEEKWRTLLGIDTPQAVSAVEEALAFSRHGENISPAMGRLHGRLTSLLNDITKEHSAEGRAEISRRGETFYHAYSQYAFSPEAETISLPLIAPSEPVFAGESTGERPEKSTGWVVASGGGNILDAGVIFRAFSQRLQVSLLTGFSYTPEQLLSSLSGRAAFVLFPGTLSPSLSLWAKAESSLVLSEGLAAIAGPSLGIEFPLFGGAHTLYIKNTLGVKLYPPSFEQFYYLPSVGIKQ